MLKRVGVLVALCLSLLAGSAPAHTTIIEPPGTLVPYQRWVDEAKVPTPTTTIYVAVGACASPTSYAAAYAAACFVDPIIWMRQRVAGERRIFFHELGHAFDRYVLTDDHRYAFRRAIKMTARPWNDSVDERGVWTAGVEEVFADAYSRCALQYRIRHRRLIAPLDLTPRLHETLCGLIRSVALAT